MSQIKNDEKIFKNKKVVFQNVHQVDFKTGSPLDLGDSFDLFIKGILIENRKCPSFAVNSAHVLKYEHSS